MTLLAAAVTSCVALTAPPASAITEAGKYANQAHRTTNDVRAQHHLGSLSKHKCLKRYAVRQAKAMAAAKEMFHQNLAPVLKECNLAAVGENVAYGYVSGQSVVVDGWMNSVGHRANMLNPLYKEMGIGARKGDDGNWYVSQVLGRTL